VFEGLSRRFGHAATDRQVSGGGGGVVVVVVCVWWG
jgi:hypothetical protein